MRKYNGISAPTDRGPELCVLTFNFASATSATADGLAPEGASLTKKFCLRVIKKRPRKKFCLQVIKKRPRKPDVADVHEWCSAATVSEYGACGPFTYICIVIRTLSAGGSEVKTGSLGF
ncbi:hypothetical protein EVAR_66178_1 [Eumeta japonica]|uniref:Uncharacterized protein n=1 Tax=Eumeta variegata TaxID=151549 RepID=A0A4C1ZT29_EUMVA|nr:hypothetical protein EVAR_66178_1 [Eumeta japonica]